MRPALDSPILANGPKVALGLGMTRGGYSDLLKNGGFQAFLWTQFLGAFNDNVYQTIVALHAGDVKGGAWVPLVPAVFTLPALLFSGYSGHLADRVSKRSVLIGVKVFEIAVMLFGLAALATGWTGGMLLVLFLMGLHSTVFSPAKYGIVPEMLPDRDLSRANALLEMSTFVAIVLGIAGGGLLFAAWTARGLADRGGHGWRSRSRDSSPACGSRACRLRARGSRSAESVRRNRGEHRGISLSDRPLWLTVLGISYFWFAGALLKIDLLLFGSEVLHARTTAYRLLWAFLAIGIGAGNMLAGRLSGDKVELGLVPLGSILMGVFAFGTCAVRRIAAVGGGHGLAAGSVERPVRRAAERLHAAAQRPAGKGPRDRHQQLSTDHRDAAGVRHCMWLLHDRLHIGRRTQILLGFGVATLLVARSTS